MLSYLKKACPDTPVILITAFGDWPTFIEAYNKGVFEHISKPFKIQDLKEAVRKALDEERRAMTMRCPKCGGLMSFERFMSTTEGMPWCYEGWRCIYCGEVIDPLILHNRLKAKAEKEEPLAAGARLDK